MFTLKQTHPVILSLRQLKNSAITELNLDYVRTRKNIDNKAIADILTDGITQALKKKVRTLETRIIANKKASCEAEFKNGAGSGTISEPPILFYIIENQESKQILQRMSDLLAA